MKTKIRMKCKNCGHWNKFEADELFTEQIVSETESHSFYSNISTLKTDKCSSKVTT